MKILDATAGTRSIWYQKDLPFVTFMDKRKETIRSNHKKGNKRNIKIDPDIISEWKDAPFEDNYFDMIVFDPPHLIRKEEWSDSTMVKSYGKLFQHNYKHVLKEGVDKLFKILKPDGIFILKWCDTDRPVEEIIKLFPYKPLFGSKTGQHNTNHWIVFIKYRMEKELEVFQ